MYVLALVLKSLQPGQAHLLSLPTAISANLLLPLQQDFKRFLCFLHLNKICIQFLQTSLHCAASRCCLRKMWLTFFRKSFYLVGHAHCSCLPLWSLCLAQVFQLVSEQLGVLARFFYCVFPGLCRKKCRMKGLRVKFLPQLQCQLYQWYSG